MLLIQADQTGVSEALQGEVLPPDICFNFAKTLSLKGLQTGSLTYTGAQVLTSGGLMDICLRSEVQIKGLFQLD